jgi:hypothetical protein
VLNDDLSPSHDSPSFSRIILLIPSMSHLSIQPPFSVVFVQRTASSITTRVRLGVVRYTFMLRAWWPWAVPFLLLASTGTIASKALMYLSSGPFTSIRHPSFSLFSFVCAAVPGRFLFLLLAVLLLRSASPMKVYDDPSRRTYPFAASTLTFPPSFRPLIFVLLDSRATHQAALQGLSQL